MLVSPTSRTVTAAGTAERAVTVNAVRTTATEVRPPAMVPTTERSASRPPTSVPIVMPRPNRASAIGTCAERKPDTSVSVGAM